MTALRLSSASFHLTDRPYPRDACGACASLSPILFFCTHVQECFSTAKTTRNTRKLFALEITENLWTKCIGGFGFIWKRTQNRQSFESLRASQDLLMARAYSRPTQTLPSVAATRRSRSRWSRAAPAAALALPKRIDELFLRFILHQKIICNFIQLSRYL